MATKGAKQVSEDCHDSTLPPLPKGPQFESTCTYPGCPIHYKAYTQKGADALMAMHFDDHKRGWVKSEPKLLTGSTLTVEDRKLLEGLKIKWE